MDDLAAKAEDALSVIPADDRDTWVRMAFAVKNGLGDSGFHIWDSWSRTSPRYQRAAALSTWRNAKPYGGVTIGTLFAVARAHGWQSGYTPPPPDPAAERRERDAMLRAGREQKERWALAASTAQQMLDAAEQDTHPYLAAKGFPETTGFVLGEHLLVPLRDTTDHLWSLQQIAGDGAKRFLPGGRVGTMVHRMGDRKPRARWFVEGYATGLSIMQALYYLDRKRDEVWVTFSAHGMATMAHSVAAKPGTVVYLIADHDSYVCACRHRWYAPWGENQCPQCKSQKIGMPAGESYARRSELPFWIPSEPGDANDWHQAHGIASLAQEIRTNLLSRMYRKNVPEYTVIR